MTLQAAGPDGCHCHAEDGAVHSDRGEILYSLTFCERKEENGNFQLIETVHTLTNGKLIEHSDPTNKEPGRM
jgi:hypothetical protein